MRLKPNSLAKGTSLYLRCRLNIKKEYSLSIEEIDAVSPKGQELIKKYNIEYIVVSYLELQKYNKLNENNLLKIGEVVYKDGATKLYKINSSALD